MSFLISFSLISVGGGISNPLSSILSPDHNNPLAAAILQDPARTLSSDFQNAVASDVINSEDSAGNAANTSNSSSTSNNKNDLNAGPGPAASVPSISILNSDTVETLLHRNVGDPPNTHLKGVCTKML